jgi:hypothetical protein
LLEEARKSSQRKLRTLSTIIEERSGERVGGNASALAALHQLDPRVFNGEDDLWFNFLMGAKCVGISEDDFVDWSIGDPDYWDHGDEIRRRWNSVAGLHAGAFYATLKQADIKLQPTKPTTKYNSAEGSQSAKAPFHHYSTNPVARFHRLIADLKKDGREKLAWWTTCEIAGMVLLEGWPTEKVARRYLENACKVNGLHNALYRTLPDGTVIDGAKQTIDNAFAHIREKIEEEKS